MERAEVQVVIVDDELHVLTALRRTLRRLPFLFGRPVALHTFSDAEGALVLLLTQPVDVVISDFRMPGMGGIELLRRTKELQPHAGRLLMSGTPDFSLLLGAVNTASVARVILKPWVDDELLEAVRQCVELRQLLLDNADLADQQRVQQGLLSQPEADRRQSLTRHAEITEVVLGAPEAPLSDPPAG
jgi:two-component system, probable response regulator PhcQ